MERGALTVRKLAKKDLIQLFSAETLYGKGFGNFKKRCHLLKSALLHGIA